MGEVYRARDMRLDREVAIKILPEPFASDAQRIARFEREAKTLATLNHPHIAQIYGVEEEAGTRALVMELVDGETLADRLTRGAIPVHEALLLAQQIVEALDAAHEHGIVHRDLKPANIKLRPDGMLKVLDFGLAKALDMPGVNASHQTESPTITSPAMTHVGGILGTAAYMAPEQAKGKPVDRRADIWAFGCVLYEMLTGRRPFAGEDVTDLVVAVMSKEPVWAALPSDTPPRVVELLRRCLTKQVKDRLRDIGDARFELHGLDAAVGQSLPTGRRLPGVSRLWFAATMIAAIAGTATATMLYFGDRSDTASLPPSRFVIATRPASTLYSNTLSDVAVSPDGRRIVFTSVTGTPASRHLYTRSLDRLDITPIPGTLGGRYPFLSPDGAWVGFQNSGTTLMRVGILGGPATKIVDPGASLYGASWASDDTIVFATASSRGLLRVPAAGGEPIRLTSVDATRGEIAHMHPEVLPGGGAVLFTAWSGSDASSRIALLSLESGEVRHLIPGGANPRYAATGHIVFGLAGSLRAVPFDLARLEVIGEPASVLDGANTKTGGGVDFSFSREGSLVYIPPFQTYTPQTFVWVDRTGRETPIAIEPGAYGEPRLAPDGKRLAVTVREPGSANLDIWVYELSRGTATRLTSQPGQDWYSLWTLDGQRVVFGSDQDGEVRNLYWTLADGTGQPERLTNSVATQSPWTWSSDGQLLIYQQGRPSSSVWDIHALSVNDRTARVLLGTEFMEFSPSVSPDGRWIAYSSNETGSLEIYVRPFPNIGAGKWRVSTGGGFEPTWSPNSRELFYRNHDKSTMMGVSIRIEPVFTASTPIVLFKDGYVRAAGGRTYDVSPDGQRFLMVKQSGGEQETLTASQVVVVLNWFEMLRRQLPVD